MHSFIAHPIRLLGLICWLLLPTLLVMAQDDAVHTIISNDPFDPDRGVAAVEETEAALEVEEIVVQDADLPVLDGIILLGKTRMALFSNVIGDEGEPRNRTVRLNGDVAGYQVTAIEREHVVLTANGQTTTLRLFSGQKKARGGSKKAQVATIGQHQAAPNKDTTASKPANEPSTAQAKPQPTTTQQPTTRPESATGQPEKPRKNPPRRI